MAPQIEKVLDSLTRQLSTAQAALADCSKALAQANEDYGKRLDEAEAALEQAERENETYRLAQDRIGADVLRCGKALEQAEKALGGLVWLDNNRHNYGSKKWLQFFDAAVKDARAALKQSDNG
jgi:multidrug resistance efflux pump